VLHERLRPVDGAEADAEHPDGDAEAEEQVVDADGLEIARGDREREVRDDEPDAADDGRPEPPRDAADLLALLAGVEVGDALVVRREAGDRDPIRADDRSTRRRGRGLVSLDGGAGRGAAGVCHVRCFFLLQAVGPGQLDRAASHTVTATIAPITKTQTNRPSATGPRLPSS